MNAPYNQDVLAAAEACFAQAPQLLYSRAGCRGRRRPGGRQRSKNAPFGMDDADVREGMALMDAYASPPRLTKRASTSAWRRFGAVAAAVRGRNARCAQLGVVLPRSEQCQLFSARTLEVREQYRRHGLQIERLYAGARRPSGAHAGLRRPSDRA